MRSAANLPLYDINDLKDKINKLKERETLLCNQKRQLQDLIIKREKEYELNKHQLNVLMPTYELNIHPTPNDNNSNENANVEIAENEASSDNESENVGNKKQMEKSRFYMLNEKLEMKILIDEIRQALPQLENQAKMAEQQTKSHSKLIALSNKFTINTGKSNAVIWKMSDEMEQTLEDLTDQLIKKKAQLSQEIDQERIINQNLLFQVTSMRKEISLLTQEKQNLKQVNQQMKGQVFQDELFFKSVNEEFYKLREELHDYHNGFGWQTESFHYFASGKAYNFIIHSSNRPLDNRLPVIEVNGVSKIAVNKILPSVMNWIRPNHTMLKKKRIQWMSEEFIREQLKEVFALSPRYNNYDNTPTKEKNTTTNNGKSPFHTTNNNYNDTFNVSDELIVLPTKDDANEDNDYQDDPFISSPTQVKKNPLQPHTLNLSANNHSHNFVQEIDLHTYCLLCDRLVALLE